jgi:GDPmannose 4,6-dehydratase
VTRKIAHGAAHIALGLSKELHLGNVDARRDWGFAGDYVRAMWLMLQQPEPKDYVVGSGDNHSVQEFVELAFKEAGLHWQDHVRIDASLQRPAEVDKLLADPRRAQSELGWKPSVRFPELVLMMVRAEMDRGRAQIALTKAQAEVRAAARS